MAGAAAAAGHDLAAVLAAAQSAAQSVGSMGVATSVCTLPGAQPADPPRCLSLSLFLCYFITQTHIPSNTKPASWSLLLLLRALLCVQDDLQGFFRAEICA